MVGDGLLSISISVIIPSTEGDERCNDRRGHAQLSCASEWWLNSLPPGKNRRAAVTILFFPLSRVVTTVHGFHGGYQCRDKVLSVFGSFVACAGTASDELDGFIYALDWSDGGTRGECQSCHLARASRQRLGGVYAPMESA